MTETSNVNYMSTELHNYRGETEVQTDIITETGVLGTASMKKTDSLLG